jgi:glutamate/tyrosine decarboxylase-like PLP-dependent enzyme
MSELFSQTNEWTRRRLHELVSDHPEFEVVPAPALNVYCFRYVPNSLSDRQDEPEVRSLLDRLNREIVEAVRRRGHALVEITRVRGRVTARISISSANTLSHNVEATFESIARWGRLLNKKLTAGYQTTKEMEAKLCLSESHFSPMEV